MKRTINQSTFRGIALAEIGMRERMLVKDVMTSPAITVGEDVSVKEVAQLMYKHRIGCIIVTGKDGKPLGMITERDLVIRVLVENTQASKIRAKDVMSTPLITTHPDEKISDAARRMSQQNIRRLAIIYKGNLVGIISSKDILAVTPELIEIIQEKARLEGLSEEEIQYPPFAGYCDQCGRWSDNLKETEGSFLCRECRIEINETEY